MNDHARRVVAGVIVSISLLLSLAVLLFGGYDPGFRLAPRDGILVVADVQPFSQASRDGVQVGMLAVTLNGRQLIRFPEYRYPEEVGGSVIPPEPIVVGPSRPTPVPLTGEDLFQLSSTKIQSADLIDAGEYATWSTESQCCFLGVYYPVQWAISSSGLALLPGLALVLGGVWWLSRGGAGESLRPLAIPAAVATATPLIVQPLLATVSVVPVVVAGLLTIAAMLPLAIGLAERIEAPQDRRLILVGIGVFTAVAIVSIVVLVTSSGLRSDLEIFRWASIAAIPLVPGLAAAGPIELGPRRGIRGSTGKLLQSTELALAGATPIFALGTDQLPYLWPIAFWLLAIALAGRFTVRPLARLATRAQLQRDLVVAATEAERARLAADIHDEALQELTLLVRRLETAGDTEGAELARTVADRLRAICGDLRLPILDDLGVGPALDWLVLRIERLAGGEVRLERADGTRPPPDVELAMFRVAQEALANAVKHGRPPIVVRYRSTESGASLSIDDAGPGIPADAGTAAESGDHFGILNMQQRAEQIGALLDIRRWPAGGTHVALEWRAR
jgi:signal transduction histidine kinase